MHHFDAEDQALPSIAQSIHWEEDGEHIVLQLYDSFSSNTNISKLQTLSSPLLGVPQAFYLSELPWLQARNGHRKSTEHSWFENANLKHDDAYLAIPGIL